MGTPFGSVTLPIPYSVTLNATVPFLSEPQGQPRGPHIDRRERLRPEKHRAREDGRVEDESFPSPALSELLTRLTGNTGPFKLWAPCHLSASR